MWILILEYHHKYDGVSFNPYIMLKNWFNQILEGGGRILIFSILRDFYVGF